MTETLENPPLPPGIANVAKLLEEQIAESHKWVIGLFDFAGKQDKPLPLELQMSAVSSAMRLMKVNAAAALALRRLHGNETRHTVTKKEAALARQQGDTP